MKLFFEPDPIVVRTKICGITSWRDAVAAIDAGADAIGINLVPGSSRFVNLAAAVSWIEKANREITTVAVTMNPTPEQADILLAGTLFDGIQLHGLETPDFCAILRRFRKPIIKAVSAQADLRQADEYPVEAILLDSSAGNKLGGTGRVFAWEEKVGLVLAKPLILSGGLTPDNVERAISLLHPFAVDVASGVESAPGQKDLVKVRAFVAAARR
jgi:phosphoribosylanthranilate isomerase